MKWRTRVAAVAFVYFAYFAATLVGVVISVTGDDARPGLIIALVTSSAHFLTSSLGMLAGDRVALRSAVLNVTVVSDWLASAGLGAAAVTVGRGSARDEVEVAVTACVLVAVSQMGCCMKTFILTDADKFDQETGEEMDTL